MRLRDFTKEDSAVVCSWITTENELYQWSADRLCQFPLPADALYKYYESMGNRLTPLTAIDDEERVVGHFFIRYPNPKDRSIVRLGFVIVSKAVRGQGLGKQLMQTAIDYARQRLHATKITLGVFSNNGSALLCYKSVGFHSTNKDEPYHLPIGDWKDIEMEITIN
ncbi:MAG: GNAT family N-acetyltransferase [Paludibacteraceae bacterium]|nr:GNAT family N-acetyltransferase [Paludibacteraceae bacterium]